MHTVGQKAMMRRKPPGNGNFDGLGREQLMLYARELGTSFRQVRGLKVALSQREQHLRELAAASIAAQEDERQWLAYEVHDRVAQTLASAFQQLQTLESMLQGDQAARRVAVRTSALLRDAIRESRNIMNDLHPPALDEFGLGPLIQEELRRFQEDRACKTLYDVSYPLRPPRDVEIALYRIFHEALINVGRHAASARTVAVDLASDNGAVTLAVRDDGPGFDVGLALQARRVGGLMSMRRRAEIIGGCLLVESSPSCGTIVRVSVPASPPQNLGSRS